MVAAKVPATVNVMAVVDKSSAPTHALTTAVMAKAVPHRAAPVQKAVAQHVAAKVVKAAVKTVAGAMATNCHATLTP
jgi:hypothetical protein